jgi:hypothetical protein
MADPSDWRLQGQERYLKGGNSPAARIAGRRESRLGPRSLEFCMAKFMVEDHDGVLHEGYCTLDDYRWICARCFADFQELFDWRLTAT